MREYLLRNKAVYIYRVLSNQRDIPMCFSDRYQTTAERRNPEQRYI